MNYNDSITGGEQEEREKKAETHLQENTQDKNGSTRSLRNRLKTHFTALEHTNPRHPVFRVKTFLATLWMLMVTQLILPSQKLAHYMRYVW